MCFEGALCGVTFNSSTCFVGRGAGPVVPSPSSPPGAHAGPEWPPLIYGHALLLATPPSLRKDIDSLVTDTWRPQSCQYLPHLAPSKSPIVRTPHEGRAPTLNAYLIYWAWCACIVTAVLVIYHSFKTFCGCAKTHSWPDLLPFMKPIGAELILTASSTLKGNYYLYERAQ